MTLIEFWQIQKLHKEGNVMNILDFRLESLNGNEFMEAQRVIYTALLCLQYSEDVRPPMAHVISMLQSDLNSMVAHLESTQVSQNFFEGYSSSTFEILHANSLETISEVA